MYVWVKGIRMEKNFIDMFQNQILHKIVIKVGRNLLFDTLRKFYWFLI